MAEKKNTNEVPYMEQKVKIKLPKTKYDKEALYCSINEQNWLIERGVEVEVPRYLATMLLAREDQIEKNIENTPAD